MEQLISRRLPARRAQSGVALIMVLIMLTAMAIAGVALVRVVDSANVISGNFAFRQSTLEHGRSGDRGRRRGPGRHSCWTRHRQRKCMARRLHDRVPLLSRQINLSATCWMARDCQYWAIPVQQRSRPSNGTRTRHWDANDVPLAPTGYNRGYAIRYVIDRQCDVAAANRCAR
jgi:hypothetical protein